MVYKNVKVQDLVFSEIKLEACFRDTGRFAEAVRGLRNDFVDYLIFANKSGDISRCDYFNFSVITHDGSAFSGNAIDELSSLVLSSVSELTICTAFKCYGDYPVACFETIAKLCGCELSQSLSVKVVGRCDSGGTISFAVMETENGVFIGEPKPVENSVSLDEAYEWRCCDYRLSLFADGDVLELADELADICFETDGLRIAYKDDTQHMKITFTDEIVSKKAVKELISVTERIIEICTDKGIELEALFGTLLPAVAPHPIACIDASLFKGRLRLMGVELGSI